MLSSLPKLADRNFILGTFLPTMFFAIAGLFLFHDLGPVHEWIEALAGKELEQAAYLLLGIWALAVVILMLNHPFYRFLEGYMFPGWLAEGLKARNRASLRRHLKEIQELYNRWAEEGRGFSPGDKARYRMLRYNLLKRMPTQESDVLPTRFGNAIKAFEVYPRDIYGADSITIWLRLTSVIPKAFDEKIEEIRSQINFHVNCCLYSVLFALIAFGRAVYRGIHNTALPSVDGIQMQWLLLFSVVGVVLAYVFYCWAVSLIPAWGELVMSAFDCYLPALSRQLGFDLPANEERRRRFWTSFSQQLIYRREPDGELPFRADDWTNASPEKSNCEVKGDVKTNGDGAEQDKNDAD